MHMEMIMANISKDGFSLIRDKRLDYVSHVEVKRAKSNPN